MTREPLRVWAGALPAVRFEDRADRLSLNPILKCHLDDRYDAAEKRAIYGSLMADYELTGPADAEVAIVPRLFERMPAAEVHTRLREAERHGLRTLIFGGSDLEPIMPTASVILLHPGPTRGAQPHADVLATPYVFADRATSAPPYPSTAAPTVAFCGQASERPTVSVVNASRRAAQAVRNLARPQVVTPPLTGHVRLRARAIDRLQAHPEVDHRFIIRDRYRAGAHDATSIERTQTEFDDNLRNAKYALCVRGTGNFSARFYEALSFGRIPVLVDTAGVLPLEDELDWRSICVWVDRSRIELIGDLVVADHRTEDHDLRTPEAVRALWDSHLSQQGYFQHLVPQVRRLLTSPSAKEPPADPGGSGS